MFIGGEFYYDQLWKLDGPGISTEGMHFLNGGSACLTVICDYLIDHDIHKVLLPSYLCPSILSPFEKTGIAWDFYQVNRDLSVDLEDLSNKIRDKQAVYLINYFGFDHSEKTIFFIQKLRQEGICIIEDNAQAGFVHRPIGDFSFNSMRKLVPYDGGYLVTAKDVNSTLTRYPNKPNHRLPVIRKYRSKLYPYLIDGIGSFEELDGLFQLSEKLYSADGVIFGDETERYRIEHLDWIGVKAKRRENYTYLLSKIKDIPEIIPIFPNLPENVMPMGLPVYFSSVPRDLVNEELSKAGIGLCVHWDELLSDTRTNGNRLADEMTESMLTLQIDQRTTFEQLDYLAQNIKKAIRSVKSFA